MRQVYRVVNFRDNLLTLAGGEAKALRYRDSVLAQIRDVCRLRGVSLAGWVIMVEPCRREPGMWKIGLQDRK